MVKFQAPQDAESSRAQSDGTSEAMSSACSPNRIRLKYLALDGHVWETSDLIIPLLGQIRMSLAARNGSWKWTKYPNLSFLHQFCDMISHVASFATLHPSKDIWSVKSICLVHFTAARFWSVLSLSPALAGKSPKWITEWPSDIEQKNTHPDIDIHKNMYIYIYKSSYRYINVCVWVCLCVLGQRISSPLPKPHTLWINLTFFSTHLQPSISWNVGSFWVRFFEPIACSESRQDRGTTIPTLPKTNVWFLRKKKNRHRSYPPKSLR